MNNSLGVQNPTANLQEIISIRTWFTKILKKNQRPPTEVARPLPWAILIPPVLLVVADF
jgi:hypothetical protein